MATTAQPGVALPSPLRRSQGVALRRSLVLMGMTVVQIRTARATMVADNAMRLVMNELARGRDMAIQRRRNIQVTFVGNNEMRLTRLEIPTGTTLVHRTIMEGNLRFALPSGTPDTQDAFGAGSALDFDGNGIPDFLGGAEDGRFYYLKNPRAK